MRGQSFDAGRIPQSQVNHGNLYFQVALSWGGLHYDVVRNAPFLNEDELEEFLSDDLVSEEDNERRSSLPLS